MTKPLLAATVSGMARPAPAAARSVSILSFLTAHAARGFTISELVDHLGMNIASAHATLAVLCDGGFLLRDPQHRTYVLGPALAVTGFAALDQHPAIGAAIDEAEKLAAEVDAEVGVSAIAGRDVIFVARRGPQPLETSIGYPGDRSPLLAPFGAVFMAWADEAAITAWLERASSTAQVADFYRQALNDVRSRGFSVPLPSITAIPIADAMRRLREQPSDERAEQKLTDALQQSEELLLNFDRLSGSDAITIKTVAAPIFDPIGRVLLSLSITGPAHPMRVDDVFSLGQRLVKSASVATRAARGRIPER